MQIRYKVPDGSLGDGWSNVSSAAAALATSTAEALRAAFPDADVQVDVAHDSTGLPTFEIADYPEADNGYVSLAVERVAEHVWSEFCDRPEVQDLVKAESGTAWPPALSQQDLIEERSRMAQLIEMGSRDSASTAVKVTTGTTTADGGRLVLEFTAEDPEQSSFRLAVTELEVHRLVTALSKGLLNNSERRALAS
jgi:hypothetical protein